MRSTMISVVTVLGALYGLLCLVLFLKQRSLIYFPQPRHASSGTSLLELRSGKERILVTVIERKGPDALIYFGGNAEDVSWNVGDFARTFPEQSIYLMHYRGYGGSSGQPEENGIIADAFALFDHVRAEHPRVTLVGRSLGSGVAVHLASERSVGKLVLITPFDSLVGVGSALFPWIPVRWLLHDKFESNRYAPQVSAPVQIIAAENDEVIPRWSTELLRSRFRQDLMHYVVVAGAGHNSISEKSEFWKLMMFARPDP